jgi:fatty acid elongase 3
MINYYFKYIELLDTVFLAFKKKPLGALLYYCPFSHR